jgi:hypothetical protein
MRISETPSIVDILGLVAESPHHEFSHDVCIPWAGDEPKGHASARASGAIRLREASVPVTLTGTRESFTGSLSVPTSSTSGRHRRTPARAYSTGQSRLSSLGVGSEAPMLAMPAAWAWRHHSSSIAGSRVERSPVGGMDFFGEVLGSIPGRSPRRRAGGGNGMRAGVAELGRGREGRPAVGAGPGQRGRALFAEARPLRVVVLAPGTLHWRASSPCGASGSATVARGVRAVNVRRRAKRATRI